MQITVSILFQIQNRLEKCSADINNQNCIEYYEQTSWFKISKIKDKEILRVTSNTSSTQPNCVHLSNQYKNQDWTSTTEYFNFF